MDRTTGNDDRAITASGLVYLIDTPTAHAAFAARRHGARFVPEGQRRDGVQGPRWYLSHDWRGTISAWRLIADEGFACDDVTRRIIDIRLPDAVRLQILERGQQHATPTLEQFMAELRRPAGGWPPAPSIWDLRGAA